MRAGILIVGSLLWDRRCERDAWRRSRLAIDRAVHVKVPIKYGRRSESRANTFTMTMSIDGGPGQAIIVPCRTMLAGARALLDEAEELWQAEQPGAQVGSISASWGCVGVRFHDEPPPSDWSTAWAERFHAKAAPVAPVNGDGLLGIPWPLASANGAIDADVILATATKAEKDRPRPEDIADAWVNQNQGHERYFFENVRHGIRTPEDAEIWRRIEEQSPGWLSGDAYAEAVAILRGESRHGL